MRPPSPPAPSSPSSIRSRQSSRAIETTTYRTMPVLNADWQRERAPVDALLGRCGDE
jgi:hypothetical protein